MAEKGNGEGAVDSGGTGMDNLDEGTGGGTAIAPDEPCIICGEARGAASPCPRCGTTVT